MKISVIVPVYKVEEYISQCINSILNQTFDDFELILVDDGSTDNSLEICERYANRDSRIVIVNQKNQGVGVSRNQGIDISTGNFISFVDLLISSCNFINSSLQQTTNVLMSFFILFSLSMFSF